MLESAIRAVYEEMADRDQPPSTISIPAASHRGRARLGWHRSGLVAAPVLAAGAVIGIALSGTLPGGLLGSGPASVRALRPAPGEFSLLRPYAAFGWVPPSYDSMQDTINLTATSLTLVGPSISLQVYAAGRCQVRDHTLRCKEATGVVAAKGSQLPPLGQVVGAIAGQPAYWYFGAGALSWQYARGGWAVLTSDISSVRTVLHIARTMKFGPAVGPAVRFPFQLTNLPADWHLGTVNAQGTRSVQDAFDFSFTTAEAGSTPEFSGQRPYKNDCEGWVTPPITTLHIDGQTVEIGGGKADWQNELCDGNAYGELVWMTLGSHPQISAASLFAHHLRLLGSNPADWTTQPIG
jgi:hypothetical protein